MIPNMLKRKRVLLTLFAAIIFLLFYQSTWLSRMLYPMPYRDDIRISSINNGVDPYLVAAIIRVESNFRPDLTSRKGAIGIMQIMPETADWIVEQGNFADITAERLHRVDVNIEVGAWYVRSLYGMFKDYMDLAVSNEDRIAIIAAAYNAGPGNVRKWMTAGDWDGSASRLADIPYGETRHYVQRVLYYYKKYENLYPT